MKDTIQLQDFTITDYGTHIELANDSGWLIIEGWPQLATLAQDLLRIIPLSEFLTSAELAAARCYLTR